MTRQASALRSSLEVMVCLSSPTLPLAVRSVPSVFEGHRQPSSAAGNRISRRQPYRTARQTASAAGAVAGTGGFKTRPYTARTASSRSVRAARVKAHMLASRSDWPVSMVMAFSTGPTMAMQLCPEASP